MPDPLPPLLSEGDVHAEVRGCVGFILLNRPQALNALTLSMVRDLTQLLLHWQRDAAVAAVLVRGAGRAGKPPAYCAGGDIRFFRQAALEGDPRLEDFFTEEYTLNHLLHTFTKPCIAWIDGICMGGGMGVAQGAALRVVTENARLAMPETNIGLFPDVGGGWFLSRCPGCMGEYLALTGHVLDAGDAVTMGLADVMVPAPRLADLLEALGDAGVAGGADVLAAVRARSVPPPAAQLPRELIDRHFGHADVQAVAASLAADADPRAQTILATLRQRSPLMLAVTLEQVRRARGMALPDELRMERDLVRNSFHLRGPAGSEVVEGVRALVVDKDRQPRWNPARIEDVTPPMVSAFFNSPWPAHSHPLRHLGHCPPQS